MPGLVNIKRKPGMYTKTLHIPDGIDIYPYPVGFVVEGPIGTTRVPNTLLQAEDDNNNVEYQLQFDTRSLTFVIPEQSETDKQRLDSLVTTLETACEDMLGVIKLLELAGVGFRADVTPTVPQTLTLKVGYSHDVVYQFPKNVICLCDEPTSIKLVGVDRALVGQIAAEIVGVRPADSYKGKGIRYADMELRLKEGKKK